MRLLIEGNNVLLLDEPTNHLDVPSREALELALAVYEGTLIVVSHDRYFVEQVADRMLWIEGGEAHLTEGGFAAALAKREKRRATADAKAKAEPSKKPVVVSAPPAAPTKPKEARFAKLKTEELERRIMAAEDRIRVLQEAFSKPEVYLNAAKTKDVKSEEQDLRTELRDLETEYQGRT